MENALQANSLITLQLENPKVNYVQQGKGTPVILTHGLAASLHDWDDLLPELAANGYVGYALDLLGHGESEKPSDHHAYTVDSVFAHFETWIASLRQNEPMILVGHSLGGALSLIYALKYPQRVRALALVNPFYEIQQLSSFLQTAFMRGLVNTHILELMPYRIFRFFVDLTSFNFYIGQRETHMLPEHIRYQTAWDFKRASSGIYNIPRTLHNMTSELSRINQPTLLLWGNQDQTLAPESFSRLAQLMPNIKTAHAFPICGHVPHQCHPALFNPYVMDFLKSLPAH